MASGISTLGAGSGLELQSMLEQLREIDEQLINEREAQIVGLESQLNEFAEVNNSLLSIKSQALGLSLSGTYLGRTATSSAENVLTATVASGAAIQNIDVVVDQLAISSSWLSAAGQEASTASVNVPTQQQSSAAIADPANYISVDDTLTLTYGTGAGLQTIEVALTAGMSLGDVVQAINEDDDNGGAGSPSLYLTAEDYVDGADHYLKITASPGGIGEENRVMVIDPLVDDTLVAPDKEMTIGLGADSFTVTVAADTTLSGLAELVNDDSANPGLTASVIDDGSGATPYFLSLIAENSGEDYRISITGQLDDLVMEEKQGAGGASLNAMLTVGGIDYQRQTNSVDDIISGLTLNLEDAGSSRITVAGTDEVATMVVAMVTAYNDSVQQLAGKTGYDSETEEFGSLARTTLRSLVADLQTLMTSEAGGDSEGDINSLYDLGMEFNRDGTITIDEDVLSSAIADHGAGVEAFFLGDVDQDIEGFADKVNDYLRTLTSSMGQVQAEEDAARSRISDLELTIERESGRLDKKYRTLTQQFIELDRYMNQMTSISEYLTGQFSSLSRMWGSSSDN